MEVYARDVVLLEMPGNLVSAVKNTELMNQKSSVALTIVAYSAAKGTDIAEAAAVEVTVIASASAAMMTPVTAILAAIAAQPATAEPSMTETVTTAVKPHWRIPYKQT